MDELLVLGAGKSSIVLIDYLSKNASKHFYRLKIIDTNKENLDLRVKQSVDVSLLCVNLNDILNLENHISKSSIVISMLPPDMHLSVARLCLKHERHFLTASYISSELKKLDEEAKSKGLIFLMECGLDPGLDHMSAMKILDNLKEKGAFISSFRSFCGGLVAPESDNNPWGYKITWNPRNVVMAGKGISSYLLNGKVINIDYNQLFRYTEAIQIDGHDYYEAYPNRDSLSYIETYGLEGISTFLRGTIRKKGFCSSWNQLIKLGLTNETLQIVNASNLTINEFICKSSNSSSMKELLSLEVNSEDYKKLSWLGCFSNEKIETKNPITPAEYLQVLLERKWKLDKGDKDLVLMQHQIEYELNGQTHNIVSSISVTGKDSLHTAMSKTVGFPLAIATLLVYKNKIASRGVLRPILKEIYNPILEELQQKNLIFREKSQS